MIVETIIKKIKGDANYTLKDSYSTRDTLIILYHRVFQLIRGLFQKPFFKQSKGLVFVGRHVSIRHAYLISAGSNLIIEDNVYINALGRDGIRLGNHVSIARDSILICTGVVANKGTGITIGNNTGVNARAYFAGQGGISIGNNVIFGPDVKVFSENHNFQDKDLLIKNQGETRNPVSILDNCWIGAGATILSGVTIGAGCVVAAGSVVNRSFPDNSVIGGVPAKLLKER